MNERLGVRRERVATRSTFLKEYQVLVRACDVAAILCAILTGLLLGWGYGGDLLGDDRPRQFFTIALLIVWPIALWQAQSTKPTSIANGLGEYRRVIIATVWTGLSVRAS